MKEEPNPFKAFEVQSSKFKLSFWTILFLIFGLITAFTFIPLPSKIITSGEVSTIKPSIPVELEQEGKVIYVHDKKTVDVGTPIIEIEKDIKSETIEEAIDLLNKVTLGLSVDLGKVDKLRDLQYAWNEMVAAYNGIQLDPARLRYLQKLSQGRSKLNNYKVEQDELIELISLSKEEYELIEGRYNENKKLFEEGGISKQDLDSWQKQVLAVEQKLTELDIQRIRLESAQSSLQENLQGEKELMGLDKNLALISFEKQLSDLKNLLSIRLNKQKILSPVKGHLILSNDLVPGSYHKEGKIAARLYAGEIDHSIRFFVAAKDRHKLEIGNTIKIYPEDFPKQKFGYLSAQIQNFDTFNENGLYEFNVQFDSLTSNKGIQLTLTPGMQATVKVRTKSESIFSRIQRAFNP